MHALVGALDLGLLVVATPLVFFFFPRLTTIWLV
jgi:hypothetical protein